MQTLSQADYFIAPNGNDAWSGTRAAPNKGRSDGPFATPARAQAAVRRLKQSQPNRSMPIVVRLRGGTYFLPKPLEFSPEDSGSERTPIIYAAYGNEKPVISGGVELGGWKVVRGRWQLSIPEVKSGAWDFTQLFVGGERRFRPRLPRDGYRFIAGEVESTPEAKGKGFDRFRFAPGDLKASWHNLDDVEILAFHIWSMSRMRLAEVDEAQRIARFTAPTWSTQSYSALPAGGRYIVENVREALREPGQWYLDRKSGALTYIPRAGEDPARTAVIAPRLEQLVRMKGDVAARRWVRNIRFEGLTFAHTNWTLPPGGYSFPQAEAGLSAAISAEAARDIALQSCAVQQTGAWAIEWGAGCKNNRVAGCALTDLGAGGVKIGEMNLRPDEEAVTSHIAVEDTLIAHGGRLHPAAVGVWIGHSPHNSIQHNDIHDLYYTGISPGWSWGYGPSGAHHNTIAYNHIHTIGQGVLSDMGGIYTLGVSPGTVLHHNLIHDIESVAYGGWGIYFDEGTTGVLAENNIVYRTRSAGFHQHYGRDNVVRNNIFAWGEEAQLMRTRPEEHLSFTLERNIVLARSAPLLGSNWQGGPDRFKLDSNVYWDEDSKTPPRFAGATLEEWRQRGQDKASLVADPLFVDAAKADFRLRPDSPARRLGFVPIDTKNIGSRAGKIRMPDAAPAAPRAYPRVPPPPPFSLNESFEDAAPGLKASVATTSEEENSPARIRVTDEAAATGKQSLKFSDAAGQQQPWNPHLYYTPRLKSGVVKCRFALRIEAGATLHHEWRDAANPYRVGPSLIVGDDGALMANGRALGVRMPPGQWVRFSIVCGLGAQSSGAYDLQVTLPGAAPQRFDNLPCNPEWRSLDWFGFTSNSTGPAVFYLDDLHLKARDVPTNKPR